MKTKTCTKCGVEKSLDEFDKQKLGKFGVRSVCKDCRHTSGNKKKNELFLRGKRECTCCHKIKDISDFYLLKSGKFGIHSQCKPCVKIQASLFYENNKEKLQETSKNYRLKNKLKIKQSQKQYYIKNKNTLLKKASEYYLNNKEKVKNYQIKNKEKIRQVNTLFCRYKYQNDIHYKITNNLRGRINKGLQGKNKSLSTMFLIGCEIDYLMYHLQEQFQHGMTWDNHGDWHIDHIKPCNSFDLTDPKQQEQCFHYTNLQPLWAIDNIKKSDKY